MDKRKEYKKLYNRKRRIEREEVIKEYLGGTLVCYDCSYSKDSIKYFDFHHLVPKDKLREVPKLLTHKLETLLNEVDKCLLLCPTCHRERHING